MKLITKTEELVVGSPYHLRNKHNRRMYMRELLHPEDKGFMLQTFDIIECETPTAQDFDRLIQESE
jgi:hypothetical protein